MIELGNSTLEIHIIIIIQNIFALSLAKLKLLGILYFRILLKTLVSQFIELIYKLV